MQPKNVCQHQLEPFCLSLSLSLSISISIYLSIYLVFNDVVNCRLFSLNLIPPIFNIFMLVGLCVCVCLADLKFQEFSPFVFLLFSFSYPHSSLVDDGWLDVWFRALNLLHWVNGEIISKICSNYSSIYSMAERPFPPYKWLFACLVVSFFLCGEGSGRDNVL